MEGLFLLFLLLEGGFNTFFLERVILERPEVASFWVGSAGFGFFELTR